MLARRILVSCTVAIVVAGELGCGSKPASSPAPHAQGAPTAGGQPPAAAASTRTPPAAATRNATDSYPQVLIKTTAGEIKIRLNAEKAPLTVENFLENYVKRGFYSGTIFHHVDQGFIIAGGGYTSDGKAKPTRAPIRNEADNGLKNRRGTIAMARDPDYVDSATSQFFINLADNPALDYEASKGDRGYGYCVFGEVVEGMEVVDRIAKVAVRRVDEFPKMPAEPLTVESVTRLR